MGGPGLPKKYAKMGFKKGWAAFKRSKKGRKTSSSKGGSKTTTRKRSFFSTGTIFKWLRIAALVAPAAGHILTPGINAQEKLRRGIADYTGYQIWDGKFNVARLANGWMPYIVTCIITHGVQKLNGIIRSL